MKKTGKAAFFLALLLVLPAGCGAAGGNTAAATAAMPAETAQAERETAAAGFVPAETSPSQTQPPAPALTPEQASAAPAEDSVSNPPSPEPAQEAVLTCSLWIRCDTILDNADQLAEEKAGLVPEDGILLQAEDLPFQEGESVFDLLLRVTREQKLHMEFSDTPVYDSAYIEGIGNLYEFDCGELSGWSYKVNGEFPQYGCSCFELSDGDVVEWVYTCDLGRDVGGSNGWGSGG